MKFKSTLEPYHGGQRPLTYRLPHNKRSTSLNGKCRSEAEWNESVAKWNEAEQQHFAPFFSMSFRSNMSHILQHQLIDSIVLLQFDFVKYLIVLFDEFLVFERT